ncbi:Type II/IV secretion system protein [Geodermatophilus saharensis]|uniref:Type II/IV secretion system protein n=1 Tax=Geodermatophilus saharensis TaxID=1137994 RepID=A0A239FDQ5_9ACTN|nr:ATPase, T2SS/T4P/T4SS family [Geodermatophilus saharensis]SNS54282.1 Type II/IV secretion system protein [Geodermatophilus saharensis]
MPTATSALDVVDGEVRELIRRRGLDPFTDPGPVRVLVRDVVADYSERSLTSALPPVGDPEAVVRDVLDRVAGFGPLQRWLDDPEVEEIWVNEPGRVFVARRGRSELTTTILGAGELADLVERMLRTSGRRIDMSQPFVDAMLPDGSRLHVVIPKANRSAVISPQASTSTPTLIRARRPPEMYRYTNRLPGSPRGPAQSHVGADD